VPAAALTAAAAAVGRRHAWTRDSLILALAARLVAGPLPLNYYDVGYALVWGREILRGRLPDYQTAGASTPHPLGTLLATVAALFGSPGGWYVVEAVVFLSLGVAGAALFRLARTCLGRVPDTTSRRAAAGAVIAAGALLLSPPFLTGALGGSGLSDMPALALVLAAAALIAESPDRWHAPLVLLGLAGLLRPEAWGLAGSYWLFLAYLRKPPHELARAAALVLAAPVLWALCDLVVTGNPTYSLTRTQDAAVASGLAHGLPQVPRAAFDGLRSLVGLPVLLIGAAGAAGALAFARRASAPALGLLAVALAEFAVLGVADVPLLERFLLVAAAMTCFFFAYAVVAGGHGLLRGHRLLGRAWQALAAVVVLIIAGSHLSGDVHVRRDQRAAVAAEADLVALAGRPEVRAARVACPAFYVARFTLTSLVAYDLDLAPQSIQRTTSAPPQRGLILAPVSAAAGAYFGVTPARLRVLRAGTLAKARLVSRNRSWRLYERGCPNLRDAAIR
jgi:hypothetical protein